MGSPVETRSEKYLRFSRRSTLVTFLLIVAVGAVGLALVIRPGAPHWGQAVVPLWIVAVVLVNGLLMTIGGRWNPRAPEARAIAEDEWRRRNIDRARRIAFVVVLAAQAPLAFAMVSLPSRQAVLAMAIATVSLGLSTLFALFLYFDRDEHDVQ